MPKDSQFIGQDVNRPDSQKVNTERDEFYAALERAESLVKNESPRAKLLIYVAAIEQSLSDVLRTLLVPSTTKDDTILNARDGFALQIDVAYRAGIISQNLWRDLHIFRELREDCHGRIENFNFEHSAIKSSILMLERNVSKQVFTGLPVLRITTEDKFSFLARIFLITLENLRASGKKISEPRREKLYREE